MKSEKEKKIGITKKIIGNCENSYEILRTEKKWIVWSEKEKEFKKKKENISLKGKKLRFSEKNIIRSEGENCSETFTKLF